jgi:hypothetical protein
MPLSSILPDHFYNPLQITICHRRPRRQAQPPIEFVYPACPVAPADGTGVGPEDRTGAPFCLPNEMFTQCNAFSFLLLQGLFLFYFIGAAINPSIVKRKDLTPFPFHVQAFLRSAFVPFCT